MRVRKSKIVLNFSLVAIFVVHKITAVEDDYCQTPSNKTGTCIFLKDCNPLLEILYQEKLHPENSSQFLRQSHCGFVGLEPKVCCNKEVESAIVTYEPEFIGTQEHEITNATISLTPPDVLNHANFNLLANEICGPIIEHYTIDSARTELFEFPWMALIAYAVQNRSNFEYYCGGSIINKRYILTAAHCVAGLPDAVSLLGVRVGDHDLNKNVDCELENNSDTPENSCAFSFQDMGIESSHYHPEFSKINMQNDIALLRLNTDIDFRPRNVRPICLPFHDTTTLLQDTALVSGWGISTQFGPQFPKLSKIRLPLVKNDICRESYEGFHRIKESQICVSGKKETKFCIGDSGGPLQATTFRNGTVIYVQYGISSFGDPTCFNERLPNVYTKVSYYMNWVLDTIKE